MPKSLHGLCFKRHSSEKPTQLQEFDAPEVSGIPTLKPLVFMPNGQMKVFGAFSGGGKVNGMGKQLEFLAMQRDMETITVLRKLATARALMYGFQQAQGLDSLTRNRILQVQSIIQANNAGDKKLPRTVFKNEASGEVVYTPPQHPDEILRYMDNLERFINGDELAAWDDLTKNVHQKMPFFTHIPRHKGRTIWNL